MDTPSLIDALKATPAALRGSVRSLKGRAIADPPADGEWSLLDIVRHVRASDAILAPRIVQVLVREGAPLAAFDERAWSELIAAADVPIDAQLAAFAIQRAELTALLRTLTPAQWLRSGVHEECGVQTLADICEYIAAHEAEHLAEAAAIVAARTR